MMSPDPPREESRRDSQDSIDLSALNSTGLDEEDDGVIFVHDGPYELDISDGNSEFESDDEVTPRNNDENENIDSSSPQSRTRAYYQLLIPFVTEGEREHNQQEEQDVSQTTGSSNQTENFIADFTSLTSEVGTAEQENSSEEKREIQLTQENVDTIKDVMKGFALPQDCIPPWAKEVDEDTWKKRLFESIEDKIK